MRVWLRSGSYADSSHSREGFANRKSRMVPCHMLPVSSGHPRQPFKGKRERMVSVKPEPIRGEFGRYRYPSRTQGKADHIIDLAMNDGNGQCSCQDFEFRRGPNYRENGGEIVHWYLDEDNEYKVGKDCTQCFHIHEALIHLATVVAQEAGDQQRAAPVTIKENDDGLPF
jgi:hypothetical protein